MPWPKIRSLLAGLTRRNRLEDDMAEEIRGHIEARARDLARSGLDAAEAQRQARLEFGAVERYKEEVREARGLRVVDELRADLVCGLRGLRRAPGFTAVAAVSLALGVGANTLVFSLVDAALLRPLSLPEPERLVTIWNIPDPTKPDRLGTHSITRYVAFRDRSLVRVGGRAQWHRLRDQEPWLRRGRRATGADSRPDGLALDVPNAGRSTNDRPHVRRQRGPG